MIRIALGIGLMYAAWSCHGEADRLVKEAASIVTPETDIKIGPGGFFDPESDPGLTIDRPENQAKLRRARSLEELIPIAFAASILFILSGIGSLRRGKPHHSPDGADRADHRPADGEAQDGEPSDRPA